MLETHAVAELVGPVVLIGATQILVRSYADLAAKITRLEESSDASHWALALELEQLRPRRSHLIVADAIRRNTNADPTQIALAVGKPAQILMNPDLARGG